MNFQYLIAKLVLDPYQYFFYKGFIEKKTYSFTNDCIGDYRCDDRNDGSEEICDGHDDTGIVGTEINVINLKTAENSDVKRNGDYENDNWKIRVVFGRETETDESKSRTPLRNRVGYFADYDPTNSFSYGEIWEITRREYEKQQCQIWQWRFKTIL